MSKKRKVGYVASIFALMISSLILVPPASSEPRSLGYGSEDHGHPYVGRVGEINDDREFNCTGTLIGKRTVLTAAHCFKSGTDGKFEIGGQLYHGQAILHPDFYIPRDFTGNRNDLAIINLDRDVIGVSPTSLCQAQTEFNRLPVTLVGFGAPWFSGKDNGTKNLSKLTVARSSNTDFLLNADLIHYADYGGPALIETNTTECIIGVASSMKLFYSADILYGASNYYRPDEYIDWVNSTSGEALEWVEPTELSCSTDTEGYESCNVNNYWRCYINPGESETDGQEVCDWGSKPRPSEDCAYGLCPS